MKDEHDDAEFEDDFPDDDFFADDDSFYEDDEEDEEEDDPASTEEDNEPPQVVDEPVAEQVERTAPVTEPEPLAGTDDIPMTIHVEVARLKMPLNSLLQLQAGNLLDLKVNPENPVNLVVNDRVVGRGELVVVGDVVGVKVLEVG